MSSGLLQVFVELRNLHRTSNYILYWIHGGCPSIQFTMEKNQDNKLPFLNVLVTCTEQGFRSSVYHKPTFIEQYLNFNSHHPYKVKKGIVHCLQHWAKTIGSDTDTYQEEMISLRHNLYRNNYPERMISAPRNLDRGQYLKTHHSMSALSKD